MLEQPGEFVRQVYSVSDLNAYIRALLESNENLMDIWIEGEVSNLSKPRSGHIYFTLKDMDASVRCVIWRVHANRLAGVFRDGMRVEVHGNVSVYEGAFCEIMSLTISGVHPQIGSQLLSSVIESAKKHNCGRIIVVTTNDNTTALRVYQKMGFCFHKLRAGIVEESRKIKPQIPLIGKFNIPIRDELELEMIL